tara:strand:+ start:108 stop:533 length:426 start_codon:yes stop_codon:yes gene_type:complete
MPTASITLTSADIAGDPVNVSKTSTCYKADSTTPLDQTNGLQRLILTTASAKEIYTAENAAADLGLNKNAKVFIRNASTVTTEFITVTINATVIGKLYAGQWLFMPWSQNDTAADIKVTASGAGKSIPVEHMLMHEGYFNA